MKGSPVTSDFLVSWVGGKNILAFELHLLNYTIIFKKMADQVSVCLRPWTFVVSCDTYEIWLENKAAVWKQHKSETIHNTYGFCFMQSFAVTHQGV